MSDTANRRAETPAMDLVPTPVGTAGITWYPAHGPVRAVVLLGHGTATGVEAADLPTLILQGERDPFGRPDQFPALPPEFELIEIPAANHTFDTPGSISRSATMRLITDETLRWIERQLTRT